MKVELDETIGQVRAGDLLRASTFVTNNGTRAMTVNGERVSHLDGTSGKFHVAAVNLETGDIFRLKPRELVTLVPMKVVRDD